MGKIWAICSGSGGVGKTTLALALAMGAAKNGKRTVLLDASGISRSCDLLLGLESVMTIDMGDVLTQQMDIASAIYPVPQCSGLSIANASLYDGIPLEELSGLILAIQSLCDLLVIDLPTGHILSAEGVMSSEDEWLFVLRADDAAIRATERLMNRARNSMAGRSLILNRIRKERVKRGQQYAPDTVSMLLDAPVIGTLMEDDLYSPAVQEKNLTAWGKIARLGPVREILDKLMMGN